MLKNRKIIMVSATVILAITPYHAEGKTRAWSTVCKTGSGVVIGSLFGCLRAGAHMATRSLSRDVWGTPEDFILRKPLAIMLGLVGWLSVNSLLEISRTSLAEKIEQNLDDERENIYLTDSLARHIDWIIGLMGIVAYESPDLKDALIPSLIPADDTLPKTTE